MKKAKKALDKMWRLGSVTCIGWKTVKSDMMCAGKSVMAYPIAIELTELRKNMKKEGTERQIVMIKQMRAELGMNRTDFSRELGIPLRTVEEWEAGNRKMPDYQLRMLVYYVMGRYVWFKDRDELFKKIKDENQL